MRIGIVLHPYGEKEPGGLPRVIFEWANALLTYDKKDEYVIFVKNEPTILPQFPKGNWKLEVLGGGFDWLKRLKKKTSVDICIFNTPVLPLFYRPKKSIVIAYDFPYKHLPPKNLSDRLLRIVIGAYHKRSLKRADAIVAVSDATKREVVSLFNIPEEKVQTIYHGFKRICAIPEKKVSTPESYFFFAGTLKERKNVFRIIEGYHLLKQEHPEITQKLFIGGKSVGPYYEKLRAYVEKNDLTKDVVFGGHLKDDEMSYVYKRAFALVFPSLIEGSGNPILEAMDCGVPVITSNTFGPAELGSNGSALLINPLSSKEITDAMYRLISDGKARNELIKKGLIQADRFSWDKAVPQMTALFEKLQ